MKTLLRQLLKHPYYRDIIVLLFFLDSHNEWIYDMTKKQDKWVLRYGKYGLSQKHFRYILMKQHELDELETSRMVEFEKDNKVMVEWFTHGRLKGSITSQKNLNHYLKQLKLKDVIKPLNKKKPFRYVLFDDFRETYELMRIEDHLNGWENNYRKLLPTHTEEDGFIFGLDEKSLTKEDLNKIAKHLDIVQKNLWKIVELKNKKRNKKEKTLIDFVYHAEYV